MLYQYGYWQGVVQIGVCLMSKCGEVWGSAKPKQRKVEALFDGFFFLG